MTWWRRWRARRHQRVVDQWVNGVLDRARHGEDQLTVAEVLDRARLRMEAEDRERDRRAVAVRHGRVYGWYGP